VLRRTLFCLVIAFSLAAAVVTAAPPAADWFPKAPALPAPTGQVIRASTPEQLLQAIAAAKPGATILLADGHYMLPRYVDITRDNITLRGESGDRHKVILDGARSRHHEILGVTGCRGVVIADLTVQNCAWNGIKLNTDLGATEVTIHNCVLHNIWQRGVKAPAVPKEKAGQVVPRDCRIQYCLFYNDRPKRYADDPADTERNFKGNYIGGIDVKSTLNWKITDNVFLGIQGRTREGRAGIYISENGRGCVIERNVFIECDIAIALGNPSLDYSPLHAIDCAVRDNLVVNCPETGILACYTKNCRIEKNTIVEPDSKRGRLIWAQFTNEGLEIRDNVLIGAPVLVTSKSEIERRGNVALKKLPAPSGSSLPDRAARKLLAASGAGRALAFAEQWAAVKQQEKKGDPLHQKAGEQPAQVWAAMRKVHAGFKGQEGRVAQFGNSITYSMAFWTPIGWDEPQRYLTLDDGLPKTPKNRRWRDYVKGTRDKGPKNGNYSGWRVGNLLRAIDTVLERDKPEAAIIMIGTNDISGGRVPADYRAGLEKVVQKCLTAHCVPILNTIPPRRGHDAAVKAANEIIRETAKKFHVPLTDYHAEIVRLRPGKSWDGTVMSRDGVHPSGGKTNIYTTENMKDSGYALRNWVNFLVLRQLYFRVLRPEEAEAKRAG